MTPASSSPAGQITVTTACDANYFWGAFLMAGTLRQHGMTLPVHVLGKDFSGEQKAMLEQLGGVSVLPLPPNSRSLTTSKPDALATVETEWMAWIDADCVFTGDLSRQLIPPNGELQIRVRGPAENATVYTRRYAPGEEPGTIPRRVLEQWRADVGDLQTSRLSTVAVANVIVLHRRFRPFVELWRAQMDRVLAPRLAGVIAADDLAYHQTDESVLNSLLAFSSLAPAVDSRYLLDDVRGAHIGHFGGPLKPWTRWSWRGLNWYETVLSCVDWAREKGYRLPPLPPSLERKNKARVYLLAGAENLLTAGKRRAAAVYRAGLRSRRAR